MSDPSVSRQSEIVSCPGCAGRGFTVALGSMVPCGRCHGAGEVDLAREEAERKLLAERDARLTKKFAAEMAEFDRRFGESE